ncbi:ion transporter [Mangrovihabitans endophyticus]|uniref:Ion transporter n=1 Tax=Mangrovihabitans endophyticus TaxID=1751298 RepID=A0A8J3C2B9_9ACTN|nr:ion transporter [Mangrovihabitans endophyticus]
MRWERATAYPLTILSVLFIAVYAVPILAPGLGGPWRRLCETLNFVIWGLFGAEYLIRLAIAADRRRFVRSHWFDLVVLLLPILRPLRALRLVTALKILNQRAESWTRGRLAIYVGGTTVLLVAIAALAVLDAERGRPDSNIETYPQALWWGVVTITTVGYGDFYPATLEGRFVALAMMIAGIGLIGFVTGSLASWIVDRISTGDQQASEATRGDVESLLGEIREMRAELAGLRAQVGAGPPDAGTHHAGTHDGGPPDSGTHDHAQRRAAAPEDGSSPPPSVLS